MRQTDWKHAKIRIIVRLNRLFAVQNFCHEFLTIAGNSEVGDEGLLGQRHVEGHFLCSVKGVLHGGLDDCLGIAVHYRGVNFDLRNYFAADSIDRQTEEQQTPGLSCSHDGNLGQTETKRSCLS